VGHNLELDGVTRRCRHQDTPASVADTERAPVEGALYCGQHIVDLVIPLRVNEAP
jgi:hypothetical protein